MQLAVRSFGQLERVDETVDEVDLVLRLSLPDMLRILVISCEECWRL